MFRGLLIFHDRVREGFERSLRLARKRLSEAGSRNEGALGTTYILGRRAVKDTCPLLADWPTAS